MKILKRVKETQFFTFRFSHFTFLLYLCTRLEKLRALSSAGLEHLPYKQRVGGSNPSAPTKSQDVRNHILFFFVFICFSAHLFVPLYAEKLDINKTTKYLDYDLESKY